MHMAKTILEARDVVRSFGETRALAGVSLSVSAGEIHGLIGENGSGKSTLSSIVAGMQTMDSGGLSLNGAPYAPESTIEAVKAGVQMILQEQGTIDGISVAANIFLGEEHLFVKNGILQVPKMIKAAREALTAIGADHIDPKANVDDVSFEDRKVIEIARAMYTDPILLIVDETTTALPRMQREILYSIMQKMREEGRCVLFISHDIEEILEVCDRVTILRDGSVTGVLAKEEMQPPRMKQLMVGRSVEENYYRKDRICSYESEVVLRAENISSGILEGITFELHKGEILGISGLTDGGMHDLGRVLYGITPAQKGRVTVAGGEQIDSVTNALAHAIGYISKNRDMEALMLTGSIKDNICLPALPRLKRKGLIFKRTEQAYIAPWLEKLSVKMSSPNQLVHSLSGGNKQKVSVAKWLALDSNILIMDCPTRGIDVGVKANMYDLMSELKGRGKSIIMISEELPELIGMCDRILTIKDGKLSNTFHRSETLSESEIIEYII